MKTHRAFNQELFLYTTEQVKKMEKRTFYLVHSLFDQVIAVISVWIKQVGAGVSTCILYIGVAILYNINI